MTLTSINAKSGRLAARVWHESLSAKLQKGFRIFVEMSIHQLSEQEKSCSDMFKLVDF